MATTLADIRTAVSAELRLTEGSGTDQTEVDRWANDGVRHILAKTQAYVTSQTPTPGATADFSLDTLSADILDIVDLYFTSGNDQYFPERVDPAEILRLRRASPAVAGPTLYYALAGHDTLMWYPTPGASDVLTLYYVPLPTEMSNATHDPFSMSGTNYGRLPILMWDALFYYVCWKLASLDDDSSSEMGDRYLRDYRQALAEGMAFLRRRGGARLPRARVNRRRQRLVAHDNSADV